MGFVFLFCPEEFADQRRGRFISRDCLGSFRWLMKYVLCFLFCQRKAWFCWKRLSRVELKSNRFSPTGVFNYLIGIIEYSFQDKHERGVNLLRKINKYLYKCFCEQEYSTRRGISNLTKYINNIIYRYHSVQYLRAL